MEYRKEKPLRPNEIVKYNAVDWSTPNSGQPNAEQIRLGFTDDITYANSKDPQYPYVNAQYRNDRNANLRKRYEKRINLTKGISAIPAKIRDHHKPL